MGEAPDHSSAPRMLNRRRRLITAVHVTAIASPLLILAGPYGAWALAWARLGHRPRPMLDDPYAVLGAAYYVSGLLVLWMPAGAIVGLCSIVLLGKTHRLQPRVLIWTLTLVALWVAAIALAWWDPLQVVYWWFD